MKIPTALLLACILGATTHAAPPSQSSFEELLKLTNTQGKLDFMARRIDDELKGIFERVLANQGTSEAAVYATTFRLKVQDNFQKKFTVEALADSYLKEGHGDWTQEEVDALLALAEKPAGRSALAKLGVTQQTIETLTLKRIAQFTKEPAQSLQPALKELMEINTKALAAQQAKAPATPAAPESSAGKPAEVTPLLQAEPPKSKS